MKISEKVFRQYSKKQQKIANACWKAIIELSRNDERIVPSETRLQKRVREIMESNDTIPYLGALQLAKEEIVQRQWEATIRLATNPMQRLKRFCTPNDTYYHDFNFETAEFYE